MAIDFHAHWMPRELYDACHERGTPRLPDTYDAVETRLAEMDEHGYTHAILSLTPATLNLDGLPLEDALPLMRVFNDATSAACAAHPDRFSGFAALPSANLEVMIEEYERAAAAPGMVGAVLPGDGFISLRRAERFAPLFRAANERGAIFLVHYGRLADDPDAREGDFSDTVGLRRGTLDMQARLSAQMITFCLTDFLNDYPNVTVITHNLGGNIPFEVERMDHRTLVDRPTEELPSRRFRAARMLVDCNSFGSRAIEMAAALYGPDKIVCGSDGTTFGMNWTNNAIAESNLSEDEKQLILSGNASAALAKVNRAVAAKV
jgi:predicted TIM-barrel fold metal-dependent hydrolase